MNLGLTSYLSIALTAIAILLYVYTKWMSQYWKRRGVESYHSSGNLTEDLDTAYKSSKSKNLPHGGMIMGFKPIYVPVDLNIIRDIVQKSFDHFVNRGMYVNEKADPLSGHLFRLEDQKWRKLRATLTPTFTSGKTKMMFHTMADCTVGLIDVLRQNLEMSDPVDIKDVVARFTTDIIGSVAFGIDCNSLKDPDSEFRKFAKLMFRKTWRRTLAQLCPKPLLMMIGFSVYEKYLSDFFINTVNRVVNYRESNNVYRQDFLHLLLQLKNRGKIFDDQKIMDGNVQEKFMKTTELAAQCYVFFIAGYETSSTLMTFALLELAQHQKIQDKLREEINAVLEKHGEMTYEAIMGMQYLDQVLNESLRKYPPLMVLNRMCNKDFKVPGTDLTIEKGTQVVIPVTNIQNDPEIYNEPEKFDPERFSTENKSKRHPLAFLPFGEGPRMCIGARFGLLQSKMGVAAVITHFKVSLSKRTKLPIEYSDNSITMSVKGDVWLDLTSAKE